ncbi:MAG: AAA family ATPase, partial [Candidatus Sumerlaeota bacterium]|nr:AAA family ATPase [Candidatus Sumerlaeota bacterium]
MKRFILDKLANWNSSLTRKPLILRGMRQVGKTWAVMEFAKQYFPSRMHVLDFEKRKETREVFEKDLTPRRLLAELEIYLKEKIDPENDLLFLDEIQGCPRAIVALRYFFEEMPSLRVIAAGSLLEFAMGSMSFPVGRVQYLDLYPMSFPEFLLAIGNEPALKAVLSPPREFSESTHSHLMDELKRYFFIGGMPLCIQTYIQTGSMLASMTVLNDLLQSFHDDFAKYTPQCDRRCLSQVLKAAARRAGQRVKYTSLSEDFSIPTIKKAFDLLSMARLVRRVPSANPAGLPLGASVSEKRFKSLVSDIGIMQALSGMPVNVEYEKTDLLEIYQGAMAEQFVGQELLAAGQDPL